MLVILGLLFFSIVYLLVTWFENKSTNSSLFLVATAGTKKLAGTAAIVAFVFFIIQLGIFQLRSTDWTNYGLLTIENELLRVRRCLSYFAGADNVLLYSGILLIILIAMPSICFISSSVRRFLTATKWITRVNFILVMATSLTFFGTGSALGLANLQAKLVADKEAVIRGLDEMVKKKEEVVNSIVHDAISEATKDIVELAIHDNLSVRVFHQVASILRNNPIQPIEPKNTGLRFPEGLENKWRIASLKDINMTKTNLNNLIPESPSNDYPANVIRILSNHIISTSYDLAADPILSKVVALEGDIAGYEIIRLFLDETLNTYIKDTAHSISKGFLSNIAPTNHKLITKTLYDDEVKKMARGVRKEYGEQIKNNSPRLTELELRRDAQLVQEILSFFSSSGFCPARP